MKRGKIVHAHVCLSGTIFSQRPRVFVIVRFSYLMAEAEEAGKTEREAALVLPAVTAGDAALRELFVEMDSDGSGTLSMEEFVSAMSRLKLVRRALKPEAFSCCCLLLSIDTHLSLDSSLYPEPPDPVTLNLKP